MTIARKAWIAACVAATFAVASGTAAAQTDKPVEVTVYPILIEAPLFGASVDLPSVPGGGGGSGEAGEQSGTTDVSLNTLYMAGVSVRAHRWFVDARGQWADPGDDEHRDDLRVLAEARPLRPDARRVALRQMPPLRALALHAGDAVALRSRCARSARSLHEYRAPQRRGCGMEPTVTITSLLVRVAIAFVLAFAVIKVVVAAEDDEAHCGGG